MLKHKEDDAEIEEETNGNEKEHQKEEECMWMQG